MNLTARAERTDGISRTALWSGRALSAFAILFLAFDATMKVLQLTPAVEGTTQLGYPASVSVSRSARRCVT